MLNGNEPLSNFSPPQSIEAEQSVLGAIFLEPKSFEVVSRIIEMDDFYLKSHQKIYEAIKVLFDQGKGIDLITVADKLKEQNHEIEKHEISYLTELATSVPTAANISYYAEIVFNKATLRRLKAIATEIVQDCDQRQDELEAILDDAERKILTVARRKNVRPFHLIKDVLEVAFNNIKELGETAGEITGISTGYKLLNQMTAGFQRNDLIIVAARPSVGKTAFVLNIARNVAKQPEKYHVAIFSLEMGAEQLAMRLISAEGNIDAQKLRTGNLNEQDLTRLKMAVDSLSNTNIYIDDSPGIRIGEIRSKARRIKQEKGLDLIMIDYLQLIQGNAGRSENRQQEVSEISRSLKALARELEIPVISLSQLSRGVESRQVKRPIMSDIRESGSIEQDADIVAFLYREDYYEQDTENKNIIEIIIAKQRNGPVGDIKLGFKKEYNKFIDLDFHHVPGSPS